MILYVQNKLMSIGGGSVIYNENKEPVYKVKGKLISPTRKKKICDMEGNVLYKVRNKYWRLWTRYVYIMNNKGKKIMKVRHKKRFKDVYEVFGTDDQYTIEGEVFSRNYNVLKNGEIVGIVTRELTWIADAYQLEVKNPQEGPLLSAFVIAMDNIEDDKI